MNNVDWWEDQIKDCEHVMEVLAKRIFLLENFTKDALGFYHGVGEYSKHVFCTQEEIGELYKQSKDEQDRRSITPVFGL